MKFVKFYYRMKRGGQFMQFNKYSFSFKTFYLVYLAAVGAFMPYVNTYLEKTCHLTGSQIGLITAISLVLGVCVIPLWGIAGDKTRKYNVLLQFSIAATLVVLYFYSKQTVYPMIVLCAILLEVSRLGTMPMADTQATNYCHRTGGNYGSIRGLGSLGYMLAGVAVGFIADIFGLDGAMFATYAVLLVIALSISFMFPKYKTDENEKDKKDEKANKGAFKELIKNKKFLTCLSLTLLLPCVVDSAMNYGGNHLTVTLGGPASSISLMTFCNVLPEVIFLMIALKVINRMGFKKFYLFVAMMTCLRFAVYAFIPNQYAFLAASVVHCLCVAISTVASLTFIRNTINPIVLGTAITLLNAAINIGKAIWGYLFGVIYEIAGSFTMFGICLIPFILAIFIILKTDCFDDIDKNKGNIA